MSKTREKFRELLNDIAVRDGVKRFNKLAELTGIAPNTFTRIKKNESAEVDVETFQKLNAAFDNRYNIRWFIGDSPYMTVKEMLEAKDSLPVSQIQPDSSAEIIASLKRELERQEISFNNQLAAKDETIAAKNAQLADKDETIMAQKELIANLQHQLAQRMTKEELSDYPFVIGVADDNKKSRKRI
jgi:transcriptional regulator with XRE-family HTH domain